MKKIRKGQGTTSLLQLTLKLLLIVTLCNDIFI